VLFTIANTRVSFFLSFLSFKGVCGILLQLYVLFDSAPSQAPNVVVSLGVLVGLGMILLPIVGICSLSTRRTRRVTDAILWSVLIEVRRHILKRFIHASSIPLNHVFLGLFAFQIRALTHWHTGTPSSFLLPCSTTHVSILKVLCDTAIVSAIVLLKRPSTDAFSTSWRTFVFHGGALWAAGFASRKLNIALKILIVYYERNTFSPKVREKRAEERRGV
jgi:hypothetical protein